ncbi:hypothetical protein FRC02_010783 [Tulasnella sp. 418]|nr:hypothetical protein FRC02_010783 [Tulasnella sp. 418]
MGKHRSPFARGMQRQAKFLQMQNYHFDFIHQALPILLQISLSLFVLALIIFLWDIDYRVASIVLGFGGIGPLFYSITIASTSPFSTSPSSFGRLSRYSWWDWNTGLEKGLAEELARSPGNSEASNTLLNLASECVVWMKENATEFNSVAAMARTATLLPEDLRREKNLKGKEIASLFITSILANNELELGAYKGTLNSTLRSLLEVVMDWKPTTLSNTTVTLITKLQATLRLIVANDQSSSELVLKLLGLFASNTSSDRLHPIDMDVLRSVLAIPSLDSTGKRVALKFLWVEMNKAEAEVLYEWLTSPWFEEVVAKLLSSTQWLDAEKTVADPDEELLRFRLLWNQHYYVREKDGITGIVAYHANIVSVSSYLRSWISTNPSPEAYQHQAELILTEFIKAVGAAHGNWGLEGGYPFPLKEISETYADDEHIEGALQWVGGRSGLGILEVVSPCVWAFYHSTNDPPAKSIAIPKSYFRTVVNTLLESDTIIDRIEQWIVYRMGYRGCFSRYAG